MSKVFLGGTCNNSTWREYMIENLEIDYFDPVVLEWTEEAYQKELIERKTCDFCLYVVTPLMTGVYSIAEVVDDSNKRPDKTIFCYLSEDKGQVFSAKQLKSLQAVGRMVEGNGAKWLKSLDEVVGYLNGGR